MKKLFTIFSVLLLSAAMLQAQTVNEIIENYLENIGGAEAWKEVKSTRMTGKTMTQMGAFPATVSGMMPNKQLIEIDIQGKNFIQAFDGETAWMLNPFMGGAPEKAPQEMADEMAKNKFQDEFIDWEEKGSKISLEGKKEIEGTETFEVKLVTEDGEEKFYYFDTENYVPIMTKAFASTGEMEGKAVEIYLSDYQEVDGLMIPFSIEQKMDGQSLMQMTADTIEINPEGLTADNFAYPTEDEEKEEEKKEDVKKIKKDKKAKKAQDQ